MSYLHSDFTVGRSGPLGGSVEVPGDKSISHRAAILGAVAEGITRIQGYSPAEDCRSTLLCLSELGVEVRSEGSRVLVEGRGPGGLKEPAGVLDAGNSATTMRLLAGVLAAVPFSVTVTGDESLRSRPMNRILEPLSLMGASARASDAYGHPPITVGGGHLRGIDYRPPVASAQVKSAILIAALSAAGETTVSEAVKTRDHTERMLSRMEVPVRVVDRSVTVEPAVPVGGDFSIPGDVSSAGFLITAGLICEGSELTVRSVGLNPTRTGFLDIIRSMGADVRVDVWDEDRDWEPRGEIKVRYGLLESVELGEEDVARAIDEIPLIALLATRAKGRTIIRGASELRLKESDRIKGTVDGLRALGADITETADGMIVAGPCLLRGCPVQPRRDHRLAMMLAVAGLAAEGETTIREWEWTGVSFPGFGEVLRNVGASTFS